MSLDAVALAKTNLHGAALALDEAIRRAADEGASKRSIAEAAGMSPDAVTRRLRREPLGVRPRLPLPEVTHITPGQERAFFGKLHALDAALRQRPGTSKRRMYEIASELLGRKVDSLRVLEMSEASTLLDRLDEHIDTRQREQQRRARFTMAG